jgi:hypothetical protein
MLVLLVGGLMGCQAPDKQEASTATAAATKSSPRSSAAQAGPTATGTSYQYRAVCIEKDAHGGHEYVLSKWLDSREQADGFGQYHGDFKEKGHRWRIDERVKPE